MREGSGVGRGERAPAGPDLVGEVLAVGRQLVTGLRGSLCSVQDRLATCTVPVGDVNILVLGVPIPVFAYVGDDNQDIQRGALAALRKLAGPTLHNGHRLGFRTFASCLHTVGRDRFLRWLPRFRATAVRGQPALLGAQLVTLYPLSSESAAQWPDGPAGIVTAALKIADSISDVYEFMDMMLAQRTSAAQLGVFEANAQ